VRRRGGLLFLVSLLAGCALATALATAAAAREYTIEEKIVKAATAVEGTSGVMKLKASGITIECKKDTLTGKLEEAGAGSLEIKTSECTVSEPTHCSLKEALTIKATGTLVNEPMEDELKPSSTFEITGAECAFSGRDKLEGTQTCELPKGREELAEQELACKTSGSKLTFAGKTATYESTEKVKLTTGESWGVVSPTIYFTSYTGEYPDKLSTTQTNIKLLEAGKDSVTCGKVELSSELAEAVSRLVVTPSYSECKADLNGTESSATVAPGSCKYELASLKEAKESEGEVTELTGETTIEPSTCKGIKIEVPASKCTFEIPPQGPFAGTSVTPDGEDIEVTSEDDEASVTASGCGEEKHPAYILHILVHWTIHIINELLDMRFDFISGGVAVNALTFGPGEQKEVEIRNLYLHRTMLIYYTEFLPAVGGWTYSSDNCWGIYVFYVYVPGMGCKVKIKAPVAASNITFHIHGRFFPRGTLALNR
jgi:hypothetical protein